MNLKGNEYTHPFYIKLYIIYFQETLQTRPGKNFLSILDDTNEDRKISKYSKYSHLTSINAEVDSNGFI